MLLKEDGKTLHQAIVEVEAALKQGAVGSARVEAEYLVEYITGASRVYAYLNRDKVLSNDQYRDLQLLLEKRLSGYPLQYMTGKAYFRNLVLTVTSAVLIPRPETELLVDLVLDHLKDRETKQKIRVVDVGTGSGAIILSLAQELPAGRVEFMATDISGKALDVAAINANKYGLEKTVRFLKTPLIDGLEGKIDIIVANLPYIPTTEIEDLPADVRLEPRVALDGGPNGCELVESLIVGSSKKMKNGSLLFLEIGIGQHKQVRQLLARHGFGKIEIVRDYAGIERFIFGEYFV